ncbi:MAG TPA: hypothetical protein ENH87_17615 [Pricia antarctica]|uniref:Uncharacterized protein n=1 Tax=Pricia antarctica TaxID=641691 RepID=A0A831VWS4_9FLAO|nr:hypothetical protein [Pricia antarctica]
MPLHFDSFKNNIPERFNSDLKISGLESFRSTLEKYFFSEVTITNYSTSTASAQLAIELNCNLSLIEMLFHFNKGSWGNFKQNRLTFEKLLRQLQNKNEIHLDIEEFTLFLKDTTIVINKIFDESIVSQLQDIFRKVGEHYVHLSKGLTETPYEIYIPVFEECSQANDILIRNIEAGNQTKQDYYKFWGLYCDSEDDAVIYDLENFKLERGDLFMLNH